MKTVILSPRSVNSRNSITTIMEENQSSYYPGCRKDANCSCDICLQSINATLDLMPKSVQKSSLTRLSAVEKTPILIDPTLLSIPISTTPARNPVRDSLPRSCRAMKNKSGFGMKFLCWVFLFGVVFGLEFGFSKGVLKVLRPRLNGEIVKILVEKTYNVKSLNERLFLTQQGLMDYVDGQVFDCNLDNSTWKIDKEGLILNSHCILYKSAAEEVIVWGWPMQNAGLLEAGFSSRSFIILSGRAIEWPEGKIGSLVRETNSTWVQRKWSASVVQFDPNTWIVEYKQNMFLENPSVLSTANEFFKFLISRFMGRMKRGFWLLPGQRNYRTASLSHAGLNIPT